MQPQLSHFYRSSQAKEPDNCFELLGFDILLDAKGKPWLLEVNHTPSFNVDTATDEQVKMDLVQDTLMILKYSVDARKKKEQEMRRDKQYMTSQGCYRRLTV